MFSIKYHLYLVNQWTDGGGDHKTSSFHPHPPTQIASHQIPPNFIPLPQCIQSPIRFAGGDNIDH